MRGNTWIGQQLKQLYQAVDIPNVAINATASPLANIFVSLHNADPGAAGDQTTNETAYVGYARIGVARSSVGFDIAGQTISLHANATFGACSSGGGDTISHFAFGELTSGAGRIFDSGPIGTNLGSGVGVTTGNLLTIPGLTGVAVNDRVSFYALPGGALPGGITSGTIYFVKTVSGDTITISTTSGGAAVTISADGSFMAFRHTLIVVTSSPSITPILTTSTNVVGA